jgi:hypothetical protein
MPPTDPKSQPIPTTSPERSTLKASIASHRALEEICRKVLPVGECAEVLQFAYASTSDQEFNVIFHSIGRLMGLREGLILQAH